MQPSQWILGLVLPLALLGADGTQATTPAKEVKEAKDGIDVYFRDSDLESLARQELAQYPETAAGESKRLSRDFPDAPPQISHTVDDMLPITATDNECLECHHPSNATGKKDLPLPKSHFSQPQMAAGPEGQPMVWVVKGYEEAKDVVGARYNCVMCHTPQAGNARVVKSTFVPAKRKKK
jgi:cytochrome c-type protein NapB